MGSSQGSAIYNMIPRDFGVLQSPTLRTNVEDERINICLICGDKGDLEHLIYCDQCKACAEHSYCRDEFYREDDETVIWRCEDCAPNNPKKGGSEELRKSKRISHAAESKCERMKMQTESVAVRKPKSVRSSEGFHAECIGENDIEKSHLILEDNNVLHEEPESPEGPLSNISSNEKALEHEEYVDSEALTTQHLKYPEFDKHSRAHPLSDPVWKGQFILNTATDFGLFAYASSKACSKVLSAVTALPTLLDVEMLSRCAIWPKRFDMSPPNGDSIGLYFFPWYERDELIFDRVLNNVIEQ